MPSQVSLNERQYYGNPQNAFWSIMSQILEFSTSLDYEHRLAFVRKSSFAIWDVLSECERPGSLDSNIVKSSEVANDLGSFLKSHHSVKLIAFNGGAAKTIFKRHCDDALDQKVLGRTPPQTIQLPSTSPAYASMKKNEKLRRWKAALSGFK